MTKPLPVNPESHDGADPRIRTTELSDRCTALLDTTAAVGGSTGAGGKTPKLSNNCGQARGVDEVAQVRHVACPAGTTLSSVDRTVELCTCAETAEPGSAVAVAARIQPMIAIASTLRAAPAKLSTSRPVPT